MLCVIISLDHTHVRTRKTRSESSLQQRYKNSTFSHFWFANLNYKLQQLRKRNSVNFDAHLIKTCKDLWHGFKQENVDGRNVNRKHGRMCQIGKRWDAWYVFYLLHRSKQTSSCVSPRENGLKKLSAQSTKRVPAWITSFGRVKKVSTRWQVCGVPCAVNRNAGCMWPADTWLGEDFWLGGTTLV